MEGYLVQQIYLITAGTGPEEVKTQQYERERYFTK